MSRAERSSSRRWRGAAAALAVLSLLAAACGSKPKAAGPAASPGGSASQAPANCPLTDTPPPPGGVPNRPVLGIKVENAPAARPQTGLDKADIVYEEPVEGGVTRFLAIYQCQNAPRIEPVRSARVEDIDLLDQFPKPLFGNAGGSPPTEKALAAAAAAGQLVNIDYNGPGYSRDPARGNDEHSLYTSTSALYSRPDAKGGAVPSPIFPYAASPPAGGPGAEVDVNFSQYSDVTWKWNASANAYQRYYNGTTPSNESDGSIMSTPNLIVQEVAVTMSWWVEDSSGSHQPIATLTGTGNALVCRQGTCVNGTWSRPSASQPTEYLDSSGAQVALVPGQTWVELAPESVTGPGPIPVAVVAWH